MYFFNRFIRYVILSFLLIGVFQFSTFTVFAEEELVLEAPIPDKKVEIQIKSKNEVAVGRKLLLDATDVISTDEINNYLFEWSFGDGALDFGPEVVHAYTTPGLYNVVLKITGEEEVFEDAKQIFVYNNSILLVSDISADQEMITGFMNSAREQNTFVANFSSSSEVSEFLVEEELLQHLTDGLTQIHDADVIMFWTDGSLGATLLSALKNSLPSAELNFSNKAVVFVTNGSISSLENIVQGTYDNIGPQRMIITHTEARYPLLASLNISEPDRLDFITILNQRGIESIIIDSKTKLNITNFMSYFVNYMINHGVPSNTLKLILILPVIATIVAFMKQVIGFDTLGVYTPSMLAISFIALGVWFGLLILIVILAVSLLTRKFLKRYRMMYIPRMSFLMIVISILILLFLIGGTYLNISKVIAISIFPMFLLINVVERCISLVGEKGLKMSTGIIGEVIIVSIVSYLVADSSFVITIMLAHSELIFLLLIVNIFLGRWKGLRLVEYFRFREVFKHYAEE